MDDNERSDLVSRVWDSCKAAAFVTWMAEFSGDGPTTLLFPTASSAFSVYDIISKKTITTDDFGKIELKLPIAETSSDYKDFDQEAIYDIRALVYLKGYDKDKDEKMGEKGTRYMHSIILAKEYDAYVSSHGSPSGFTVGSCDISLSDCETANWE